MYLEAPFSDEEMINGILTENAEVLKAMKAYFKKRIRGLVWKKGTDSLIIPQRTENVYNETLVRVKLKLDKGLYEDCNKFSAFFMKIAEFVDIECFRKMKKEQDRNRKWKDQEDPDIPNSNDMDKVYVPDDSFEDDRSEIIELCLQELSQADRELMDLFYRQGYKLTELAKMHGISHGAMKAKICRIREKVRKLFDKKDDRW